MKLLSIAIPSYNSQDYLSHAVESLLPGGDQVEILIVDDGSTDKTAEMADAYERRYPGIVRAIHKENGGHGDAVMTGLRNASGLYFKVVDSDDWADSEAYPQVLEALSRLQDDPVDMFISNYIYDKAGAKHKHVVSYRNALPRNRVFGWEETRHFHWGQYLLMHAVIYRTALLLSCGMDLPKHTFYVDDLYVYVPLKNVKKMYYLDVDLYHYFIGRDDQSVQEQVMIRRIDQYLLVNRLMVSEVDPFSVDDVHKQKYMLKFLEIVTTVSSVLLVKSGTEENLRKKKDLWSYIEKENPRVYQNLRYRQLGRAIHLPGSIGRVVLLCGYTVTRKIFGFN
ncbi:MAG: glycosyltransferase family 2 protein [Clostridia bacterium]|nr:glycosyltransferase family 2 protein [Clostridia bacterium]